MKEGIPAYNGSYWVCYLCKKKFNSGKALESHVNSPVHKEKVYHCLKRGCPKEFHSLAGLFNHLESESCGFIRFEGFFFLWLFVCNDVAARSILLNLLTARALRITSWLVFTGLLFGFTSLSISNVKQYPRYSLSRL
ncbi:Pc16g06490 [Penicillium rubens Wisconsin 54-1255]|uniref:Pc16g06490 protein n=1 Tax=Penicillium rubens (strain ATCC 28089 / DSM 1075 / NRRL 1951 / Wisconsin 54-1255) TaxID=500485 RepID=B6H9D4_PENRW|nr:Pc16g06490 [Penicillium rubens Wisconsin 54-1255]